MGKAKGTSNEDYEVHGNGAETLAEGLRVLSMPEHRRKAALELVREILAVNQATEFRWYMPEKTEQILCYWDDQPRISVWIERSNIHMRKDETVARLPAIPTTWSKSGDYKVGWLLPGAESGAGGGPRKAEPKEVLCPNCFLLIPVETDCFECGLTP